MSASRYFLTTFGCAFWALASLNLTSYSQSGLTSSDFYLFRHETWPSNPPNLLRSAPSWFFGVLSILLLFGALVFLSLFFFGFLLLLLLPGSFSLDKVSKMGSCRNNPLQKRYNHWRSPVFLEPQWSRCTKKTNPAPRFSVLFTILFTEMAVRPSETMWRQIKRSPKNGWFKPIELLFNILFEHPIHIYFDIY